MQEESLHTFSALATTKHVPVFPMNSDSENEVWAGQKHPEPDEDFVYPEGSALGLDQGQA